MSFAGATAFANAEAECPNRINRVLPAGLYQFDIFRINVSSGPSLNFLFHNTLNKMLKM